MVHFWSAFFVIYSDNQSPSHVMATLYNLAFNSLLPSGILSAGVLPFCDSSHLVVSLLDHLVSHLMMPLILCFFGSSSTLCFDYQVVFVFRPPGGTAGDHLVEHQMTYLAKHLEDYLADWPVDHWLVLRSFYWVFRLTLPPSELNAIIFAKQSNREKYRFTIDGVWFYLTKP